MPNEIFVTVDDVTLPLEAAYRHQQHLFKQMGAWVAAINRAEAEHLVGTTNALGAARETGRTREQILAAVDAGELPVLSRSAYDVVIDRGDLAGWNLACEIAAAS